MGGDRDIHGWKWKKYVFAKTGVTPQKLEKKPTLATATSRYRTRRSLGRQADRPFFLAETGKIGRCFRSFIETFQVKICRTETIARSANSPGSFCTRFGGTWGSLRFKNWTFIHFLTKFSRPRRSSFTQKSKLQDDLWKTNVPYVLMNYTRTDFKPRSCSFQSGNQLPLGSTFTLYTILANSTRYIRYSWAPQY